MSKGSCFILLVCVAISTFLLTSQFVYWVKPFDYYLPDGVSATDYFRFKDVIQLMLVGGFVFFTLSLIWRAFKPSSLKLPRTSVRRRKGEQV